MTTPTLNLMKLPEDLLELRREVFLFGIRERVGESINFIRTKYDKSKLLDTCMTFTHVSFVGGFRCVIEDLTRVWYFPYTEAHQELENALSHSLIASYKAAHDHLRRALELTVCGVYFVSTAKGKPQAREWMASREGTPNFSQAVQELAKLPRFGQLAGKMEWLDDIKGLYWRLCDVVHVRGVKKGFMEMLKGSRCFSGAYAPLVALDALRDTMDLYVETVGQMCTVLALYNPVVLVGLPLPEKFGMNPPASGFYEDGESEMLWRLLPEKYNPFFRYVKEHDEEVKGLVEWVHSHPDLTKEQFEESIRQFEMSVNFGKKPDGEK